MAEPIGKVHPQIASALNIDISTDDTIYLGDSNINHMMKRHSDDYLKYGPSLKDILAKPDYFGENKSDHSIEYVKYFHIDHEYVKVAVRVSTSNNRFFARTIYTLNSNRVNNFIKNGTLKKFV